MTERVGRCKICRAYRPIDLATGRLAAHLHLSTGNPCRGVWPQPPSPDDYPVGWDHHPADVSGGLPERNRHRF